MQVTMKTGRNQYGAIYIYIYIYIYKSVLFISMTFVSCSIQLFKWMFVFNIIIRMDISCSLHRYNLKTPIIRYLYVITFQKLRYYFIFTLFFFIYIYIYIYTHECV